MSPSTAGEREVLVAVDVGGTTMAGGLVRPDGTILHVAQVPTHATGARESLETLIAALMARSREEGWQAAAIGVGVPGIVDPYSGEIGEEAHHVPGLVGLPLARILAARFRVPAVVDNDVNALALGEWAFGAGRGARSLVLLAAGTGFGTALIVDGRLVRGAHGFAGELGHAPVRFDGPPCWCGGRGCLAVYASGRGIAAAGRAAAATAPGGALRAAAGGDPAAVTAPLVFAAAEAADPAAVAIVDEACRALGAMIAVIVNGLDPEVIVITGGVAEAFQPRLDRVLAAAADHAFARALAATRVILVPGDKRTTMRGAAALALYEAGRLGATA